MNYRLNLSIAHVDALVQRLRAETNDPTPLADLGWAGPRLYYGVLESA